MAATQPDPVMKGKSSALADSDPVVPALPAPQSIWVPDSPCWAVPVPTTIWLAGTFDLTDALNRFRFDVATADYCCLIVYRQRKRLWRWHGSRGWCSLSQTKAALGKGG